MATEFNLPGSSFGELQKIVKGYGHAQEDSSLDGLAKLIGVHKTIISRNNKFLTDIGLITGGMKKSATDLGKKLGRAIDHNQPADSQKYWREAVQTNDKVAGLVTTVRIKGSMTEDEFSTHALYVSGQNNNQGNKTGARCILDVLLEAGLLREEGGRISIVSPEQHERLPPREEDSAKQNQNPAEAALPVAKPPANHPPQLNVPIHPQIVINIQLQLPESENAEVYEKLFRALRTQLLSPVE